MLHEMCDGGFPIYHIILSSTIWTSLVLQKHQ